MSGMTRQQIISVVGLSNLDDFGVAACHFFSFPQAFQKMLPDLYQLFVNIFKLNPVDLENPIVNY
jgi:Mlc titration factor MtfA (ptsG expression regulator)